MHRATVFGRCEQTTGIEPFTRLVAQVMPGVVPPNTRRPDADPTAAQARPSRPALPAWFDDFLASLCSR